MTERRKILEEFEQQNEYTEKRVNDGIEKYRKGNMKIALTDQNGVPLSDIKIRAVQNNHEFRFGANLFMLDELENEEKNEKYKKYFADVFNMATLPFYWDATEPQKNTTRYEKNSPKLYRRPSIDLCMDFCEKNGIEPREHALAYERFFPKWLYDASVDEIKSALEKRFSEISERYADKIRTIEVTNEMDWVESEARTKFYSEPDYIEWCFKTAEKYFPNNELGINEWTGLPWADKCRVTDKYYSYIEANILKGARIDAIGMQYHMFYKREEEYKETRPFYNPESLYRHMDMYSNLGKPLQVTEITIPAYSWEEEDEEIQAEIIEKLYSIWFSHPNVEQIIYWNLIDGYAYVGETDPEKIKASQGDMTLGENYFYGGLLRFDLSPKPAYYKIKELIKERWHTEENLVTGNNGVCSFRGFYGQYQLEICYEGRKITKTVNLLSKDDNNVTIVL